MALNALATALSGKMVHSYVKIADTQGQIVGLGFGRNNMARLSYAHWTNLPQAQASKLTAYNQEKRSRVVGGALLNAFADTGVLEGRLSPIFSSGSDNMASGSVDSGRANDIVMTVKRRAGNFKKKSFDLIEFKNTEGVFAGIIIELNRGQLTMLRRYLTKYADWQKISAKNNIRNTEKSLGLLEYPIDRKTYSGSLLPDYVIYDVVFVTNNRAKPSLRFVKYQGACDGPKKIAHSSCRQTGITSASPDQGRAMLDLIDGRGERDKSDLLR